ncbi:Glycosyl hydrolase family 65 N terminal domain [Trypanosoma vivax]|uniref:Putative glycosyl hydrolase n=1 Tax=Trypanosoma vivax (strain Y486) TaxID=1055687 RepID=G0UCW5_TRYVY|nr:putative glycosyl hydrolase [Trypanosoma vivax]KAH8608222.1 Glycosyl hydrolase family 65 N terminal domain [Trypanosoma vivax]CCC53675.1 putative glycosyl hydrolase [Trypanosoma vivax Y486]
MHEFVPLSYAGDKICASSISGSTQRLVCKSWELVETGFPYGTDAHVSESLFSLSNGHVCVRGYTEETMSTPYSGHAPTPMRYSCGSALDMCRFDSSNLAELSTSNPASSCKSSIFNGLYTPMEPQTPSKRDDIGVAAASGWRSLRCSRRGVYVNGMYEERLLDHRQREFTVGSCTRESFLVSVPDAFCVDVFVGGEHVTAETGNVILHSRVFDFRTGELRRKFVWQSKNNGREVTIKSSRFVSLSQKGVAVLKYNVSARNVSNTDIRIVSRTVAPCDTLQHLKIENIVLTHTLHDAFTAVFVRTRNSCKRLVVADSEACYSTQLEHVPSTSAPSFKAVTGAVAGASADATLSFLHLEDAMNSSVTTDLPATLIQPQPQPQPPTKNATTYLAPKCAETRNGVETVYTSVINEHTRFQLTKHIVFLGDKDAEPEDICDVAIRRAREASKTPYGIHLQEHASVLENFLSASAVHIKAHEPTLQGVTRFNMLQLFMSACRKHLHGSPPRGFLSQLHGGMHQWEVDAIVIPFFSHVHPLTARGLLQFRIDSLPLAQAVAADIDLCRGALYPQRTINGSENSPPSFCAAFLFTNAVIAYGVKQYITATNDVSILFQGAADVIFSTALVWLMWGTWDRGQFHLRSVGGPDGYNYVGDNNYFTNLMAQFHMRWAVEVAAWIQKTSPAEWDEIRNRCQLTEMDLVMMEKAAAKIVILFDSKNRVHPVDQLFMRRKKWRLGDLKEKRFLFQSHDPSVIYRHQVCRMPEVVLASLLLPEACTMDEVRANYNFYEPITTGDASLSPVVFSIVAIRLGLLNKGMQYYHQVLFSDLGNIIGDTGHGLHSNAGAGSWWCLVVGLGGMRVLDGVLHFNPILPDGWEEYKFFVRHRGCLISVLVTQRMVTYTALEGIEEEELVIFHAGTMCVHLELDVPQSVRLFRDIRAFDFDCVLFNLDSLIDDLEDLQYQAWKQALEFFMSDMGRHGFILTGELYLAYLKHGKPLTSLQRLLSKNGIVNLPLGSRDDTLDKRTVHGILQRKLHCFRSRVRSGSIRLREGAQYLMTELRQNGILVGCVTDSQNGRWALQQMPQIMPLVDLCIDGNDGYEHSLCWRPEMDYFSTLCRLLNTTTERTIIVMNGIEGFSKSALEQFRLVVDVQLDAENVTLSVPPVAISMKNLTLSVLEEHAAKRRLACSMTTHQTSTGPAPMTTVELPCRSMSTTLIP